MTGMYLLPIPDPWSGPGSNFVIAEFPLLNSGIEYNLVVNKND